MSYVDYSKAEKRLIGKPKNNLMIRKKIVIQFEYKDLGVNNVI